MASKKVKALDRALKVEVLGYTLRRYYIDDFYTRHVSTLSGGAQVLDVGGIKIRKRGKFNIEEYPVHVVYVNLSPDKHPDILANAASLPLKESCFDVAICAEVLEHVPEPKLVLEEIYRVLDSGGKLFASVPFMNWIHADPYDYGRYTDYYWRENLAKIGFKDITIEKQGLFWSVLVNIVREFAYYHIAKENRIKRWVVRRQIYRLLSWARQKAIVWDNQPESQQHPLYSRFTTGFGIFAEK